MLLELSVRRDKVNLVKEAVEKVGGAEVSVKDEFPNEGFYWPIMSIEFPWGVLDNVVQALHQAFDGNK